MRPQWRGDRSRLVQYWNQEQTHFQIPLLSSSSYLSNLHKYLSISARSPYCTKTNSTKKTMSGHAQQWCSRVRKKACSTRLPRNIIYALHEKKQTQISKQTDRQAGKQTDKQTGWQACITRRSSLRCRRSAVCEKEKRKDHFPLSPFLLYTADLRVKQAKDTPDHEIEGALYINYG